ncbi:L-rhamnose-binding lectin CSL3-like [Cyprinus carpio]|uniref:L-rhamnose-binding lectin CSL3-like n=1 Tax=Cyprinus carpio TaxID=7962 RepID=A0A9R0AQD5_CYPCA|nr:L-rhamnose-binding lectin CSL3-like [Cyprinus carpio]
MNCFRGTSLHTMSTRCDGRKSCSVPAVNSVFSDPCAGTYKYLDVDYVCVRKELEWSFPSVHTFNMLVQKLSWIILLLFLCQHGVEAKRTVACEGKSVSLRCVLGLIKVIKANYGRTDRTTCARSVPAHQTSNMNCFRRTSLHTMSTRCDGRKSCSVPAVNSVFSDPCAGTYKYLDVDYVCVRKDALRRNQIGALDSVHSDPVTVSISTWK